MLSLRTFTSILFAFLLYSPAILAHVDLETKLTDSIFEPGDKINLAWIPVVEHDPVDWDLYYSIDGGETWLVIEEGIRVEVLSYEWTAPDIESSNVMVQIVQDNEITEDYSDYSDTFKITTEQLTAAGEIEESAFRMNFFPNPVLDQMNIELTMKHAGKVELALYDSKGSIVQTLATGTLAEGRHQYKWSRDSKPGGVYFIKLTIAGITRPRSIIVR